MDPSWWAKGKDSGERWRAETGQMAEFETFERLFADDPSLGLSTRCLLAADRIDAGELSERWTTLQGWLARERPTADPASRRWLAGFVHGVLEPDAAIPTP